MITRLGIWLVGEFGNRASIDYFGSEEEARQALKSLVDCRGCLNCSRCSGCSYCTRCSGCSYCSDCSECSECSGCSGCSRCLECLECLDCSRCSRCSVCSDCSDCSKCYGKTSVTLADRPIVPTIEGIHQKVFAAASQPESLEMGSWHTCETTHCRAGWVTHLAGEAGKALEDFYNTELAAMLIYRESSPIEVAPWRFYQLADEALADMKRCAEEERKLGFRSDGAEGI